LRALDVAGRRVEALDRSMISIRQLYFVVLGILAAGFTSIARDLQLPELLYLMIPLAFIVYIIGFILWQLDSHYHQYLREAIYTCETIERRLGFNKKNRLGLAINLEEWRDNNQSGKIIPAEIYLGPVVLIMLGVFSITIAYGTAYGISGNYLQILGAQFGLLSLVMLWLMRIIDFIHMD
jgi:hypothetical protein